MSKEKSILVFAVFLMMGCPSGLFAHTYSGGTGEPNSPYLIATAEDMNAIGADSNDWDKHFQMIADINMAGFTGTSFNIIGNEIIPFTGVFDGNNHTISSFTYTITHSHYIGLFGYVDGINARVKDLTLIDPNVITASHSDYIGSLVGCLQNGNISGCAIENASISGNWYIGGLVGCNDEGVILNCYSTGSVSGYQCIGGLIGYNKNGFVTYCYANSEISAIDHDIGGLVGYNTGMVSDCYVNGNVLGAEGGAYRVGGLVGWNYYGTVLNCHGSTFVSADRYMGGLVGFNTFGTISNCTVNSEVHGETIYIGGLIGGTNSTVSNCYATGRVSGERQIGGLIGYDYYANISNCFTSAKVVGDFDIGGFMGRNEGGTIYNCYTSGESIGNENVGGLIGWNYRGEISNCYSVAKVTGIIDLGGLVGEQYRYAQYPTLFISCFWNSSVNPDMNGIGNINDPNVIGKTTENMKKQSTFTNAGWDFVDVWDIGANQTYPFLRTYPAADVNHDDIVNFLDLAILADHWLQSTQ